MVEADELRADRTEEATTCEVEVENDSCTSSQISFVGLERRKQWQKGRTPPPIPLSPGESQPAPLWWKGEEEEESMEEVERGELARESKNDAVELLDVRRYEMGTEKTALVGGTNKEKQNDEKVAKRKNDSDDDAKEKKEEKDKGEEAEKGGGNFNLSRKERFPRFFFKER